MQDAGLEVGEGLLHGLLLVVEAVDLHLLDILLNDGLVIADRLDPYQLVLALEFGLQLLCYMLPSLLGGVGAVKNGDLVLLGVEEVNQVVEADLGDALSYLIGLLVVVVEELVAEFDIVVCLAGGYLSCTFCGSFLR